MELFEIFSLSFLVALTGAMSPGPLLTYTIYKSIQIERSYLVGIFICIGHAILEFGLILILLIGMGPFISNTYVIIGIGLFGGGVLVFFGVSLLRDVRSQKIDFSFLTPDNNSNEELADLEHSERKTNKLQHISKHPIVGGVLVSMSNPYWWLWWAVIGLAFMTQFSVTLSNQPVFWGFFLGHELGDIVWYVSIATVLGFSHEFMTRKLYTLIIICCSFFMIGFGLFLAVSPILNTSI